MRVGWSKGDGATEKLLLLVGHLSINVNACVHMCVGMCVHVCLVCVHMNTTLFITLYPQDLPRWTLPAAGTSMS